MGEFSPVQLDVLEDALEDLELAGIPVEFEDDAAVSGRLSEYRELLQLSREALPSVEVPRGVLDSVLAAARDEAGVRAVGGASPGTTVAAPADSAESKTPWWKRLSMWVPALAVAASAALVLVMVQGTLSDAEPAAESAAESAVASADAPSDPASKTGALLGRGAALQAAAGPLADAADEDERYGLVKSQSRGRLRGSAAVDRAKSDFAAEVEAEEETPAEVMPSVPAAAVRPTDEPTDKVIYDKDQGVSPEPAKERNNVKPSKASSGKKQAPPRATPQPGAPTKTKPDSKAAGDGAAGGGAVADPSQRLSSADQSRHKGRCSSARSAYRGLLDHNEAKIRARALAGLGLCALYEGDEEGADGYFSRARSADNGIGSFISSERDSIEHSSQQAL